VVIKAETRWKEIAFGERPSRAQQWDDAMRHEKFESAVVGHVAAAGDGRSPEGVLFCHMGGLSEFIEPMMARLQSHLPEEKGWEFEVKLDGIRAIGIKNNNEVHLFSRRPRELTADFPQIVKAIAKLPVKRCIVDGELVAFDDEGRTSFQILQNRGQETVDMYYILFDLVQLDGKSLLKVPLAERRAALEKMLAKARDPLRFSGSFHAAPAKIWKEVKRLGLEGVIAKRVGSEYEPGRRSGAWVKVKAQNEQEFVIGGYTPPQGSRKHFGSILVGYYEKGKLMFASGVGSGFTHRSLEALYKTFQKLRQSECPFANLPWPKPRGGFSKADMRRATWLEPKLVCQVKFYEWTRDGNLRQPVFLGLREDKKAMEVVREKAPEE
jgi:bifunctional non-homologous end joining protein LigD